MQFLRANTAVDVLIGPFVDDADGDSAMDSLTLDVELLALDVELLGLDVELDGLDVLLLGLDVELL